MQEKIELLDPVDSSVSVRKQTELLGVPRSTYYYKAISESVENQFLMKLIDAEYTRHPFYGSRRMTAWLKAQGYLVNRKRVQRLLAQMGLSAICPKRNLSKARKGVQKYPYLLRGVSIDGPNKVWSTDITYIRLKKGFVYLTAVIDWHSRYVLSWKISNSLEGSFCLDVLDEALKKGKPDIFNTDQGAQYTSERFVGRLKEAGIKISMDGKGRALDNIFVERLWRTVKYEEIYLKEYESVLELKQSLKKYFEFYNTERLHQSLNYKVPEEVFLAA